MINQQLIHPKSIVVVGGSNDTTKPGGKVLQNLIENQFPDQLYVTNPKETEVQGIRCYQDPNDLPECDLAILAIAAKYCPDTVELLAREKNTRAFIILSAGFHEESEAGALLEQQIVETVNSVNGCLIGPNCIGMMNRHHTSVFTLPIPRFDPKGADFISGSGATAVFIMESAIPTGLSFSSVYSVGNSAQTGVEEVLQYLDETFDPEHSSRVKLLYVESINKPDLLLKHATSLINKGCRIAAIKSGSSSAGSRAASSHTGALASSDSAVDALFRKAGIVRCNGRQELATIAAIFMHKPLEGKNIAIITHAGGPAVMLTDVLSNNGLEVPHLESPELLEKLYPGSSVANPIDFLATGTAAQLGDIIDYCDNEFDEIDAMAVIFGSPGLTQVFDVYKLLDEKMKTCRKPIYPILPSVINVKDEIEYFLSLGRINFPDEVVFGQALAKVYHTPPPAPIAELPEINHRLIRQVIDGSESGYLQPEDVQKLLDAAGIPRAGEAVVNTQKQALEAINKMGYPVVMKVVGPVHKSDVGGVVLNVKNEETVVAEFERMMKIPETTAILIQPMLSGTQIFAGAKFEPKFGHMILCGLGGIFIEVLKDVQTAIAPVSMREAREMIQTLKSYKIIEGVRGQEGVNQQAFADVIVRLSALCISAPEIAEMDINPLLGNERGVVAVDARIRVEK
ncbi:MAG: acetate--CoA ligase family protein [Lentimicrobium sp.]|jgi:acetyltransferase|nr:acetate--CoA ligase family protein [Lentimicrobium sp.]MDD2527882.1 acetate--CoA ligase family protein [Lentimicrobiaceae bacterium]MDD4597919.1 acetate--CoA ligase family protein [Lentimicrobiaceae bacterium]MDY0024395.1 acetate--CoA ligase family protein [Lentimicrobium sp.]HAH59371.1 CoA ligase [Bacteroidales bacterium]